MRATDAGGATATSRRSVHVVPAGELAYPTLWPVFESSATTGVPADLGAGVYGVNRPVTFTWDADGDGDFDDGTGTIPSADIPSESHILHGYDAPGTYRVRVKATDGLGHTRVVMQT